MGWKSEGKERKGSYFLKRKIELNNIIIRSMKSGYMAAEKS